MINVSNLFSFSRMLMVMKREIIENWKKNIFRLIGLYAAFLQILLVNMYVISQNAESSVSNSETLFIRFCMSVVGVFLFVVYIVGLVYASCIMENMRTKEQRISFLMLPATMFEKFIARFIYVTVGIFIAVLLTMFLAEVSRFIFLPLLDLPDTFHQFSLWKAFSMIELDGEGVLGGTYHNYWGEIFAWCFLIWLHSLYILGGNIWYKRPFLKTLGTLILLAFLGVFLLVNILDWVGVDTYMNIRNWFEVHLHMTYNNFIALSAGFFSILTLFNWWLSFRLFTCSQVVKSNLRFKKEHIMPI